MDVKTHYDTVTDAWLYILGDNLHYGYFEPETIELNDATDKLIDHLAALGDIRKNSTMIDVGCGVGQPAFHLHKKFACTITGISISPRGIEIAKKRSHEKGCSEEVKFQVADALDNGFSDNSFDIAWVMESSHLMKDKKQLFKENHRILKNGGTMLLCDLMLRRDLTVPDLYRFRKEIAILEKTFGKAQMKTLDFYKELMIDSGFAEVDVYDISHPSKPTLKKWKENAETNRKNIINLFGKERLDEFFQACDITELFFDQGLFGYGMAKGVKRI